MVSGRRSITVPFFFGCTPHSIPFLPPSALSSMLQAGWVAVVKKTKVWQNVMRKGEKKTKVGIVLCMVHPVGRRGCPRGGGGVGLGQRTLLGLGAKVSNDTLFWPPSRNHLRGSTLDIFQPVFHLSRYDLRALREPGGRIITITIHEISLPREIRGNGQLVMHATALWRSAI